MRAAVYAGRGRISVHDLAEPIAGPTDIVLDVEACGVCGSDVGSYLHDYYIQPGQVMGHEISGLVASVGAEVGGIEVGQRVAVCPMRVCRTCAYCRSGRPHLCGESAQQSLGYGAQGGFAEKVLISNVVVGRDVVAVPAEVTAAEVVWAEPLAVAVHAVRLTGLATADGGRTPLLVIGAGSVGLCIIAVARASGVPVVVVEPRRDRQQAAASLGAEALDPADLPARSLTLRTAVDTSGHPGAIRAAIDSLAPGSRLVLVGLGDQPLPVPTRAIQIVGSFAYTDEDFRTAVDHIIAARVRLGGFVSHRFSLADTVAAIVSSANDPSVIKAVVEPGDRR